MAFIPTIRKKHLAKQIRYILEGEMLGVRAEYSEITELTPTSFQIKIKYTDQTMPRYYVVKVSETL